MMWHCKWLFRTVVIVAVSGVLCHVCGCHGQPPGKAVHIGGATEPGAPAPPVVKTRSRPDWADYYDKCRDLIGKTKDEAVALLGPPMSTGGVGSTAQYEYKREGWRCLLWFDGPKLISVDLDFEQNKPWPIASQVWEVLCGDETSPTSYMMADELVSKYWLAEGTTRQPLGTALLGEDSKKRFIQLVGKANAPFMKAARTWDTKTDTWTTSALSPNNEAAWTDVSIRGVRSKKSDSEWGSWYGNEHPLTTEQRDCWKIHPKGD